MTAHVLAEVTGARQMQAHFLNRVKRVFKPVLDHVHRSEAALAKQLLAVFVKLPRVPSVLKNHVLLAFNCVFFHSLLSLVELPLVLFFLV
jgi:hypothetical protein